MGNIDLHVTINVALIIYLVTYLLVNGFLIYLLFRLGNTLRDISAYSKNVSTIPSGFNEVDELKASLIEIHSISAQELHEIDELKQSLFDIQSTTARQLNEINKLRQSLSGAPTAPGTSPSSGSAGMRIARSGMS
jgi:hypothetical protein